MLQMQSRVCSRSTEHSQPMKMWVFMCTRAAAWKMLLRACRLLSDTCRPQTVKCPLQVLCLLQEALKQQAAQGSTLAQPSPVSQHSQGASNAGANPHLPAALIPRHLQPYEYSPAQGGQPCTNLLILLHGLGDKPQPYAALASRMALPQVLVDPGPLQQHQCWQLC